MYKKYLAMGLGLALGLSVTACSSSSGTENSSSGKAEVQTGTSVENGQESPYAESFKIGIAEVQANDESIQRRAYFENYIAPRYNCEFIFSEQCSSTDKLLTFIENCADAGCDAVISYSNDDIEQMTQVCQEYGMIYVVNTVRINPKTEAAFAGGYENFGAFGSNQVAIGQVFGQWLRENASEDGSEGFLICSGMAYTGNLQQTEITTACLTALQEMYDLTYDQDLNSMVVSSAPIEATK